MRCIVVDDEATARLIISTLCESSEDLTLVSEFESGIEAIKFLNAEEVDLIFLDIHMPTFDGMDLIKTLKDPPQVILTTADPNFAIQAFEFDFIVDYLVKPIEKERFEKAVSRARKMGSNKPRGRSDAADASEENQLYINIHRRLIKIDIPSIYLIEAKGDYIYIKTEGKEYKVHSTLTKIEQKLPADAFLRVHRSFVINLSEIVDIEDNSVLIKREIIPVSRSKRPELMKRLNLL
ncbi:MAG: LytTR family DNA-binding domain-containing protein [Saprospiraceae bacterium]|nr:LytTR family DNA-binding domain-containing protein [Saprospiraceae bacterium]